ncbi:MAG: lysophospholipid acyltransferase family protein [Candidatus Dadabacteria bacterium]
MNFIRQPIKILFFFLIVVTFLLISFITDLIVRDRKKKLISFSRIASFSGKACLMLFGVKVNLKNLNRYKRANKNYMIVCNHLSYLDIFVVYSVLPSVFIANSELEEEFPLGVVTKYGGGIFVERRNRSRLLGDMDNISSVLNMGLNIVLFPEGTTSDGQAVTAFKAPFLKSAINTGTDVLPLCLNYKRINGESLDEKSKDLIFYYGSITFFEHFFRLLKLKNIEVELEALEEIEVNPKMTRKELSQIAYDKISSAYVSI